MMSNIGNAPPPPLSNVQDPRKSEANRAAPFAAQAGARQAPAPSAGGSRRPAPLLDTKNNTGAGGGGGQGRDGQPQPDDDTRSPVHDTMGKAFAMKQPQRRVNKALCDRHGADLAKSLKDLAKGSVRG